MLTLITGAPGAGKSAALVSLLTEVGTTRPVFVNGIPELKIPHQELKEPTDWMNEVPDGSIIVIDEVQRVWRPAGPGQKIPPDIAGLETHRHRGLDFYVITQSPKLVHSNVRGLVGRHVHLRDIGFLGRWWYEWPECNDNCAAAWKNAPIKKRYKLPKKIFGQYKSATEHIKPVRSFPMMVIVALVAIVALLAVSYYSYTRIAARATGAPGGVVKAGELPGPPGAPAGASSGAPAGAPAKFLDDRTDFIPRMTIRPESAPAYDALRVVKVMPVVAAAVCSKKGCRCYTQQGTDAGLTSEMCRDWSASRPFNPYAEPVAVAPSNVSAAVDSGGVGGSGQIHMLPAAGYGVVGSRRDGVRDPDQGSGQPAAQAAPPRS